MSLDMFQAYLDGYADHMFDQQLMTIHTGFWAGYYTNSKHPKAVSTIMTSLQKKRDQARQGKVHADSVDVDAFLEMERRFNAKLQK